MSPAATHELVALVSLSLCISRQLIRCLRGYSDVTPVSHSKKNFPAVLNNNRFSLITTFPVKLYHHAQLHCKRTLRQLNRPLHEKKLLQLKSLASCCC